METQPSSPSPFSPPTNLDINKLKPLKLLGKGATGTVFLISSSSVSSSSSSSSTFALKLVEKSSDTSLRRAKSELEILRRLSNDSKPNPFLPILLSSSETSQFIAWTTPYCSGGDLNVLRQRQNDGVFSSSVIKFYLAEILCALDYLHTIGIAYRDLKPENILIQDSGHVTLTDFDLSCYLIKPTRPEFLHSDPEIDPDRFSRFKKTKSQPDPDISRLQFSRFKKTKPTEPEFHHSDPEIDPLRSFSRFKKTKSRPDPEINPVISRFKFSRFKKTKPTRPESHHSDPEIDPDLPWGSFSRFKKTKSQPDSEINPDISRFKFTRYKKTKSQSDPEMNPDPSRLKKTKSQSDQEIDPDLNRFKFSRFKTTKPKSARVNPVPRRRLSISGGERSNSFVGTDEYISPEVILGEGHDFAVDFWALGVLTYEMMYGKTPFKERNKKETLRNVLMKEPEFFGKPSDLTDLIGRLLVKDPIKRLGYRRGAEEIKEHAFFRGVKWDMLTEVLRPPFIPLNDDGELTENKTGINGFDVMECFDKQRMATLP